MKTLKGETLIHFELLVMDIAEACEVKTKGDLEWFSATLHEHLENAIEDYAMDNDIEDYEVQYC